MGPPALADFSALAPPGAIQSANTLALLLYIDTAVSQPRALQLYFYTAVSNSGSGAIQPANTLALRLYIDTAVSNPRALQLYIYAAVSKPGSLLNVPLRYCNFGRLMSLASLTAIPAFRPAALIQIGRSWYISHFKVGRSQAVETSQISFPDLRVVLGCSSKTVTGIMLHPSSLNHSNHRSKTCSL